MFFGTFAKHSLLISDKKRVIFIEQINDDIDINIHSIEIELWLIPFLILKNRYIFVTRLQHTKNPIQKLTF